MKSTTKDKAESKMDQASKAKEAGDKAVGNEELEALDKGEN